ncbi:PH (Pleckstrin Homology) domain-containing protein [Cereibacter ovatus]|uniref:PH (Pleckstrin Homology) domain-containing protein n=1 Tax=Cereibacter ovatus TaxID=439529 RepID=A0A285CWT6_9RHOB|nr:photosynthetic complex putative assembly protein PuhB [Cereibacter ovatus]SNX72010.1 PH (Pleckstrin Homology) domain-containing protein [Cereibacter ovatus]
MDHDDFAFEPIPGLPAEPPKGETILWQGRPAAFALAREAYKVNWIAGYFAVIVAWRAASGWADGGLPMAVAYGTPYAAMGVLTYLLLLVGAYWQARATVYTITTARVAMRIGAALSVTLNLPFTQIESADLDLRKSGTGTIAMLIAKPNRISKLVCWPHIRPWKWRGQPALRCIPDAARVARILSDAAESRLSMPTISRAPEAAAPAGAMPAA